MVPDNIYYIYITNKQSALHSRFEMATTTTPPDLPSAVEKLILSEIKSTNTFLARNRHERLKFILNKSRYTTFNGFWALREQVEQFEAAGPKERERRYPNHQPWIRLYGELRDASFGPYGDYADRKERGGPALSNVRAFQPLALEFY